MQDNFNENKNDSSRQNKKNIFIKTFDWCKRSFWHHTTLKIFVSLFSFIIAFYIIFIQWTNLCLYSKGNINYNNGNYQRAIDVYNSIIYINTLLGLKNTSYTFAAQYDKASSYLVYGNLKIALLEFESLRKNIQKYNPQDKKNIQTILHQISLIYTELGYFNKAENYISSNDGVLKIRYFLFSNQIDRAKEFLLKRDILEQININIDNFEGCRWIYMLGEYYIQSQQYNRAEDLYKMTLEKTNNCNNKIWIELFLADFYRRTKAYKKAQILYSDVLKNDIFTFSTLIKIKIEELLLLQEMGEKKLSEKQAREILINAYKFSETSPLRICSMYYTLPELNSIEKNKLYKEVELSFNKLILTDESYFKNDIKNFCEINRRY